MKLMTIILIPLLDLLSMSSFAQNDSTFFGHVGSSLSKWQHANPTEKVYLHLDKPYYAAGDDIWFKAYVTSGSKHTLSGISGILNVELINYSDSVVQYIKLPLINGLTWGDFKLPDSLKAGSYRIRAYTNWMRNAGSEYFYDKTISIENAIFVNPMVSNDRKHKKENPGLQQVKNVKPLSDKINIQFFPESGDLVYGIDSKVAFKAVGDDGLGKDIKGVILDEQNREAIRFSSSHLGMGIFNLSPVSGKTYKAHITYSDGSENNINLPLPLTKGYVLHINNTDSLNIAVKIETSRNLIDENANQGINLIAQSGGEIYFAAKSKSVSTIFTAVIPKRKFPSGIVQFTLFSSSGEPLNERLVFMQNPDQLSLSLSAQEKVFTVREKMQIDAAAKNDQDEPVAGNFSVAVINETNVRVDEIDESTIFSNLLLATDIKGYIEKPNYYFSAINGQTRNDLDILMLTQGYHRFEWKQILDNNFPPVVYQPESSLEVAGYLKTLGGKPIPNGKVSLLSSSKGFFMMDTIADNKGYFAFKNLQFKDSVKFVVQSKTSKDKKNVKIELNRFQPAPIITNKNLSYQNFNMKDSLSVYLANSKKTYDEQIKYGIGNHVVALKEVKIKEKKALLNSSNLLGPGNADQVLLMKDISATCATIALCLQGRLHFVDVSIDQYGVGTFYSRNGKMAIYVDGVLSSPDLLDIIRPETIESVEILVNDGVASIYGPEAQGGAILINTKKGPDYISSTNIVAYMPKGYYKAREFYSPQYDDPKTNKQMADFRSTIYWNPNIATDNDGKASFKYFNADTKGTYKVVIEGIDGDGNLGRQVYRYKVQ
jgi:hypothetical protein